MTTMKLTKSDIFILISVFVIVVLTFILGRCSKADSVIDSQPTIKVDTVFQQRIDTIHLTHTVTKYKPQPTKADTIFIADTQTQEVAQHIQKTYEVDSLYKDTTCTPPASVNYHLLVRTYDNDVDSIGLKFNVDYPRITETQTITKTVTKNKHWGFTVGVGVGYSTCMKVEPFVGVMWGYRF